MRNMLNRMLPYISLCASFSTLICCALPALLVALGMGAVLAGVVADVPQLVWFSEHKVALFAFSGLLLAVNGLLLWRGRNAPCPADPAQAAACGKLKKAGRWVYFSSLALYAVGFFFAYVAIYIV